MSEPVELVEGEVINGRSSTGITAFTFGEATSVLDRRELLYHLECASNGTWYEPPVAMHSLARVYRVSPHHTSAIVVKRNLLMKTFRPSRWLSRTDFGKFVLDFLVMGNAYLERIDNLAGRPLRLAHSLALWTRRGVEEGRYFFIENGVVGLGREHEFRPGSIFHLHEPDVTQEIYGLPEYLSALQSGFLNEAATLFRRRYYLNGSHAGFVFYLNEPTVHAEDAEAIRESLKASKGVGNFKNLFLHAPNGKKDGVQIIPISEVAAKDEFLGIKNTTRDDILAAHRVPPQLIGVIPTNSGGFGDVAKAAEVFFRNEIEPLQMRLLELNDWLGVEAVAFDPYETAAPSDAAGG